MSSLPPTVICADVTSWEGMVQFGAALSGHGVRVIRFTGKQRSRRQRIRTTLERVAFAESEPVLVRNADGHVDVQPILSVLDDVRDVQSADLIGSELAASEKWQESPRLHRVHARGLSDVDVYDKLVYTRLAEKVGVSVPETWEEAWQVPAGGPVAVKTRLGSGGDGVRLVAGADEIPAALADLDVAEGTVLFQRRIPGQVWNVGGVADRGEVLAIGAYRGIPAVNDPLGPPAETLIVDRPDLLTAARTMVEALGYRGLFQFDFLCDDEDQYYLIDINPRIWGSWAGLQAAGVDIVGNYLRLLGARITPRQGSVAIGRRLRTSAVGPSSTRETVARTRRLTQDIGPVLTPAWRGLTVAQAAITLRPSWLTRQAGDPASAPAPPGPDAQPLVTFAYSEPWPAAVGFSAALRRHGVRSERHITSHASRMQRLRVTAESLCFTATMCDIEVAPSGVVSMPSPANLFAGALDVQVTERVADFLSASGADRAHPRLARIGTGVDPRVRFDKRAATAWARRLGIPTPEVFRPKSAEDLRGLFPVVVKHPTGYGGKWVRICRDVMEVQAAVVDFGVQLPDLLVEEYVTGDAVNVGGVAREGDVVTLAAYRPRPRPGDPTGPPVSIRLIDDPEAVAATAQLIAGLGLSGPFCVDLVVAPDRRRLVLDVNTRIFSSWIGLEHSGYAIVDNYLWTLGLADRPRPGPTGLSGHSSEIPVDVVAGLGAWPTFRHNGRLILSLWSATGLRGALAGTAHAATRLRHR